MLMIPYYVRREMINFELHFLGVRVRLPRAGLPHGVLGCIPSPLRPSPPPCGCVFGFCAVPRTVGLMPIRRLRPALPITSSLCAIFYVGIRALFGNHGRKSPGTSCHQPALAGMHLDIVYFNPKWNIN